MDPNIYALVLDTLNRATSQDAEVLKPAEKKLQEWQVEPGFYSVLLDILANHSINVNIRWLAVMCFKNGVDRYWRKNAPNAISEEEKEKLRLGLLTPNILSEPVVQIATQQAVLISKIARFDCPLNWQNLVPDLMGALKAPQTLVQHRSLLIFHHVVKALASKRLPSDRKTFQELTATVYSYILNLWHENTELFLRHIQESSSTELINEHLEKALLCLRILRKLTVCGFPNKRAHENADVVAFLNVIFDRAKTSLECRKLLKGRGIYPLELCEKFIVHLTKVALGVLSTHPLSYVFLIKPSLEFTFYFCFTEQGMALSYERFTIQCLNILKGILQCVEYKHSKTTGPSKEPLTIEAHEIKKAVFDENTVCHMCRHLVSHYFLLSSDDLSLWDSEPESFATDEAGESWKYSLRPCTEATFMELFHEHRAVLAPELVRMLAALQQTRISPDDLNGILKKDAVYNAIGLAAFDLYDEIDFDEWFTNILSQELKVQDDNYRIIRRRVCQLIGQWSGVRVSETLRPAMYAALLEPLTKPTEDVAVKLAAAEAIRSMIDDFNFDAEVFSPYASHVLAALYDLLVRSDECDTKMHVLHVVSYVIQRCGGEAMVDGGGSDRVAPLLAYLPQLWAHAETHQMLRAAVLAAAVNMIKALGDCTASFRPWVLSVVNEGTKLSEPSHVYLLEDALELWLALLEIATVADPALLQLAANLPPVLDQSSEQRCVIIYILQAYTLLCPEEFLSGPGEECMAILCNMLSDMRPEGLIAALKMAEICLSVSLPERNTFLGVKVIWPILIKVVHRTIENDDLPLILSVQLSLLSRLILKSPDLFYKVIEEASQTMTEQNCDPVQALDLFLFIWTEKMNLVTQVERWKLVGLGLAALLTTQNTTVLQRFPAILLNLTEVLNDVMKLEDNGVYIDALCQNPGSPPPSPLEGAGAAARWAGSGARSVRWTNPHHARRHALAAKHPARELCLRETMARQLEILKSQIGAEAFEGLLKSADAETLQQLREYIPL